MTFQQTKNQESFTKFVTQSFLLCAGLLEEMNIISVVDQENNIDDSYENSEMAKEMTDAIIQVIERYRVSEVDEFFCGEEDVMMAEGPQFFQENQEDRVMLPSQSTTAGQDSSQISSNN